MLERHVALVLLIVAAVAVTGCATRASVRRTDARVEDIAADVATIRDRQRAADQQIAPLLAELRSTMARLGELEARLRDTADRINALSARVTAAESSLRETIAAVEALPRVQAPPERPRAMGTSGADRAFAAAMNTFRSGEHGQAVLDFTDFLARYPEHALAPRAQFWIGEAYFRQRDYAQAIVEFRKVVDAAPGSPSAAEAWVKIGQAHAMLRQRPAAASAWERVVREHPGTEAADRARSLLRK
jgi:tol-pal system protein YbgF